MKSRDADSRRWLQWGTLSWGMPQWVMASVLALLSTVALGNTTQSAPAHSFAAPRTVLVLGDSLSAGYGLDDVSQGWVALTAQRIATVKPGWRVINASISGDTSDGGAARVVRKVVQDRPAVVIIELGANDGLRGLPLQRTRRNLAYMIGAAQGVHARVLLVGMRLPLNYGVAYTKQFEGNYRDLATRFDTAYLPFLLEPIMWDRSAFQADNMHPAARAQPLLRDHVWKALEPMLY